MGTQTTLETFLVDKAFLSELRTFYRSQLFDDVIPFWLAHARDRRCGGYVTCLGRDGSPYDWTKVCMWNSGRIIWAFSRFYNDLDQNAEWLDMARHGVEFVVRHGFAPDGRMYYSLDRDGRPLETSQDVFTELFHVAGFSEYARAVGDEALARRAWRMFCDVWQRLQTPGGANQPLIAETVPVRMFGHALICLNVLDELRRWNTVGEIDDMVDRCLGWILDHHTRPDRLAAFELVGWDGRPVPGHWGRWLNPGHMIEAGIFVIHEAQHRHDQQLVRRGLQLIDWGFKWGWDEQFGGLYNDVDVEGKPIPVARVYLAQSKLWWQHAEALYGLLLAYTLTDDDRFRRAYQLVHDYSFSRFADPEQGEWFALLDRRGMRINDTKGTSRKSIFHLGRNFYYCCRLLDRLQ